MFGKYVSGKLNREERRGRGGEGRAHFDFYLVVDVVGHFWRWVRVVVEVCCGGVLWLAFSRG